MYCNFRRNQSFPMSLIRISLIPRCFKSHFSSTGPHLTPSINPNLSGSFYAKHLTYSTDLHHKISQLINTTHPSSISSRFGLKSCVRNYSNARPRRVNERDSGVRGRRPQSWLEAKRIRDAKRSEKSFANGNVVSSWVESAKLIENDLGTDNVGSSWKESEEKLLSVNPRKTFHAKKEVRVKNATSTMVNYEGKKDWYEQNNDDGEVETIDDPRWERIRNRVDGFSNNRGNTNRDRYEKPGSVRWNNKDEGWGKKTRKEASESSVPTMVGEGIYGVGPVLAALSAKIREFHVLYIQEGLEFNTNIRKKKDKKGFEKVLLIAKNMGLSIKEIPKHDLNIIADNRPHQGLVLDASPLEMIDIKELEPVSSEEEKGALWVALDEVTDPQNVGAIIRSACFFGASGVVLCAKNSAPLSGVVSKASAGSLELMELRACENMMNFLTSSAKNGWRVLGGSISSRAISVNRVLPGPPTILVLGSEGTGLRPLVERSCTQLIRIPGNIPLDASAGELGTNCVCSGEEFRSFMAVESLNVGVAAGVLLHHLIGNYNEDGNLGNG